MTALLNGIIMDTSPEISATHVIRGQMVFVRRVQAVGANSVKRCIVRETKFFRDSNSGGGEGIYLEDAVVWRCVTFAGPFLLELESASSLCCCTLSSNFLRRHGGTALFKSMAEQLSSCSTQNMGPPLQMDPENTKIRGRSHLVAQ